MCRIFQANGLPPPSVALESISAVVRFHAMATSGLLHFSPRPFMKRAAGGFHFKALKVTELTWTRHINVICRKDGYLSPVARRLIELLKSTANDIAKEQ
jgi:DNA-binding transcriptional LysR family regulator